MNAQALIARKIAQRTAQGLGVRITGIPDRDGPFTAFLSTLAERDDMIRRAQANGYTAEMIAPSEVAA